MAMPITSSAKKAHRASIKKRKVNQPYQVKIRRLIKAHRQKPAAKNLPALFSALDRAAKKKVIHKRKASRLKSRLSRLVKPTAKPKAKTIQPQVKKPKLEPAKKKK